MSIFVIVLYEPVATGSNSSYIIGGILTILIFGYLIYSFFKPEKF